MSYVAIATLAIIRTSPVMVFDSQENIEAQRFLLLTADNKRAYYVK
jgi:hypothetical protein